VTQGIGSVYSDSEFALLLWLSHHCQRVNPASAALQNPSRILTNLDVDMHDGLVLASLMTSHIPPPVNPRLASLYQIPTEKEHLSHNASNVITAMKEMGLEWTPSPTDIVDPISLDLLLFIGYLYFVLPMYVPRASLIFDAKMHQQMTKKVQLTNPSSRPVTYDVRIEGATTFKTTKEAVSVDPNGTAEFPVEFYTPFSVLSEARLILQNKQPVTRPMSSGAPPCVISFRLVSNVDPAIPHRTLNFTAKLYTWNEFAIDVENPLKWYVTYLLYFLKQILSY
jgi:hypothetical protein